MCSTEQWRSWLRAVAFGAVLAGCGGVSGNSGDSETHFLSYCDGSCPDGLVCACGVCTRVCETSSTCTRIAEVARCVEPSGSACESAPALVCDVACDADGDCSGLGAGYRCDQGACRQGTRPNGTPQAGAGGADAATGGRSGAEGGTAASTGGRSGAEGGTAASTGGRSGVSEAGAPGASGSATGPDTPCYAAFDGPAIDIDAFDASSYAPRFVASSSGFVGVAHGSSSQGYAIAEFTAGGQLQGTVHTLWPDVQPMSELQLAVSGEVLAIVEQAQDEETGRQICRLAMARLGDMASIRPPVLYGDAPNPTSVLNEAQACGVAAVDDGFLVLWAAMTSDTDAEFTLFAQGFDLAGKEQGDRFTLASGDKRSGQFSVASNGKRVVVAAAGTVDAELELMFIEDGELSTISLDAAVTGGSSVVDLAPAHDGFIARTGTTLSVLDRDGGLLHGPVETDSSARVAPLETGYVFVASEEYLVARTRDAELGALSDPTAISDDRSARASELVYATDGSRVGLIYSEQGQERFVSLECSATPPAAPGPAACPVATDFTPLDDGCTDPVCHTMLRLDYLTLGLRGWASVGGEASPVDAAAATAQARAVFDENGDYLSEPTVSGPEAGLYTVFASPSDFGAFALVGEQSGLVVAAGGVVWSGTGQYWVPTEWNSAADIACGLSAVQPEETYLDSGECTSDGDAPATAGEALDVVLSTNLAAHAAQSGVFSAFVYLYTPTVGACSPQIAEYLVVLTRQQQ